MAGLAWSMRGQSTDVRAPARVVTEGGPEPVTLGAVGGSGAHLAPAVRELEDGSYRTDGRTSIGEVNRALGTDFESQDFETVGGLVLGHLGRIPEKGDEVRIDGYLLRVGET